MTKRLITLARITAIRQGIPEDLLLGIMKIETTYRTIFHRTAENILTITGAVLCRLFRFKMKNYTIGCCQVGIASILSYFNHAYYGHSKRIAHIKFVWIRHLLYAMTARGSIEICAWKLTETYLSAMYKSKDTSDAYREIGYRYNGTFSYGIMLDNICLAFRRDGTNFTWKY
jgi:hypothetical protein